MPFRWVSRKCKSGWRRLKLRLRATRNWTRRNAEDITDEVAETVLDAESPGSFRRWGDGVDLTKFRSTGDTPSVTSRSSDSVLSGGSSRGSSPSYSGGSQSSGSSSREGCGCGGLPGCEGGCDLMLLQMLTGVFFFKVLYYNITGHPWHQRHCRHLR